MFVTIFMVMGCMGFLIAPALWRTLGPAGTLLTALGGAIYTAGTHWLVLFLYMLPAR